MAVERVAIVHRPGDMHLHGAVLDHLPDSRIWGLLLWGWRGPLHAALGQRLAADMLRLRHPTQARKQAARVDQLFATRLCLNAGGFLELTLLLLAQRGQTFALLKTSYLRYILLRSFPVHTKCKKATHHLEQRHSEVLMRQCIARRHIFKATISHILRQRLFHLLPLVASQPHKTYQLSYEESRLFHQVPQTFRQGLHLRLKSRLDNFVNLDFLTECR